MPDRAIPPDSFPGRDAATGPWVEELIPAPDPVRAAELLEGLPCRLFLDSAVRGPRLGRYSFLTADPVAVVRSKGGRTERLDRAAFPGSTVSGGWRRVSGDALDEVRALLGPSASPPLPDLPPFQGGAAGYLAYDWGRLLEPRLPEARYDDLALPDVILGIYDWVLAWDHEPAGPDDVRGVSRAHDTPRGSRAWLISTGLPETEPQARGRRARERTGQVRARLEAGSGSGRPASDMPPVGPCRDERYRAPSYRVEGGWWDPRLVLRSSFTRADYVAAVARVREYILAGDIFQANISQRFEAPLGEPPWALYRRLRARNAAPFAAYLDFGDIVVLSASPERFLRMDVGGHVETRPIKGTRPRGTGPEHDAALGLALVESAKDRAENLMIVDLMRNDLSRVSIPGQVRVQELFALERYASVHHLVSTVTGDLAPGLDAADLLRATFPGGSITGAPKIRAMEIITELEPSARGVYCGTIGYWSITGALDTNIAIRTAVRRDGRVYFSAGGGIVADSDPDEEYRETLDKARGIIDALKISE